MTLADVPSRGAAGAAIRMWGMMENSLDVRVAAISGLLVGLSFIVLLLMDRVSGLTRRLSQ